MDDFLKAYPVKTCEYEENEGLLTVIFITDKKSFVEKWFFKNKQPKPYKIDLDEIGSFIYPLCDGNYSVEDIIETAENKFKEKIEPAEERVVKFIKDLNKNRLINLFKKVDNKT